MKNPFKRKPLRFRLADKIIAQIERDLYPSIVPQFGQKWRVQNCERTVSVGDGWNDEVGVERIQIELVRVR